MPLATLTTILTVAAGFLQQTPSIPFTPNQQPTNPGHATTQAYCDVQWIGPKQTYNIIVLLTPDEGWHVYWKNPGVSGAPTVIEVDAPDGFVIGEPMFPRPSIFYSEKGPTYGYDKPVAIFIPVTAPASITDEQVTFKVTTSWLSCRKICVMGEQTTTLSCVVKPNQQGPISEDERVAQWRNLLPKPLSTLKDSASYITGNTLHLSGTFDMRPIRFIGVEHLGVQFGPSELAVIHETSFSIPVPLILDYSANGDKPLVIEGLLTFGRNSDDPAYVVHVITNPDHKPRF